MLRYHATSYIYYIFTTTVPMAPNWQDSNLPCAAPGHVVLQDHGQTKINISPLPQCH